MTKELKLIRKLKRIDPHQYALLCEQAGYHAEALAYYSRSRDTDELLYGARLAIQKRNYTVARKLLTKARDASARSLGISESNANMASMNYEGSGMMGAAMGLWNAQDKHERVGREISKLEAQLHG